MCFCECDILMLDTIVMVRGAQRKCEVPNTLRSDNNDRCVGLYCFGFELIAALCIRIWHIIYLPHPRTIAYIKKINTAVAMYPILLSE